MTKRSGFAYLYQVVYQRDPSADEVKLGLRFFQAKSDSTNIDEFINKNTMTIQERFAQVLLMSNELIFLD